MYNILHVLSGDDGGISNIVKTYYKFIDREKLHFDIACTTKNEGNDILEMRKMGVEIFHLPMKSLGIKEYTRALSEILRYKSYHAIHVHENETSYVALKVAKLHGIQYRIAHAHSTALYTSIKNELRRLTGVFFNYAYATTVVGCGQLAGERIFGKLNMMRRKSVVLLNAINMPKFYFDNNIRISTREELNISNKFVVGFVGRFSAEKNPLFCLKIIKEFRKHNPNTVLLMVGDGDEEQNVRQFIKAHQMEEYVYLLGKRTDVDKLYQAFDAFILPSLYEGFPLVVVEALASGLPTLLSTKITSEFLFSSSVHYLDINSPNDWADCLKQIESHYIRLDHLGELDPNIYDINRVIIKLEEIYSVE